MTQPAFTAASDWEKLAADFSAWLPMLAPYGERLIELANPQSGDRVLDLACGTGEPGITLARARPDLCVVAMDQARGMAGAAAWVAKKEGLSNIRFAVTRGENIAAGDGAFDRVICRFGVMLFDNPAAGMGEIARVVKPGGTVALTVWDRPEHVLCPALTLNVMERFAPVEWPRTFALSAPDRAAQLCREAGLSVTHESRHDPGFTFGDIGHFMAQNLTGRFIEKPLEAMTPATQTAFKQALRQAALEYARPDGTIHLPQRAIVLRAEKIAS